MHVLKEQSVCPVISALVGALYRDDQVTNKQMPLDKNV